jgi:hypothetical protein
MIMGIFLWQALRDRLKRLLLPGSLVRENIFRNPGLLIP